MVISGRFLRQHAHRLLAAITGTEEVDKIHKLTNRDYFWIDLSGAVGFFEDETLCGGDLHETAVGFFYTKITDT